MFLNHTNHPSANWSKEQRLAAEAYGEIRDLPFPNVDPHANAEEIELLAKEAAEKIAAENPSAVLCQGEFNYSYILVRELLQKKIRVLAACTERHVEERANDDGSHTRQSVFRFVQFRDYR